MLNENVGLSKNLNPFVGPVPPQPDKIMLYALDAEESSMIQPEEHLTKLSKEIDSQYVRLTTAYTTSVLLSSKKDDHFILDEVFQNQMPLIDWLRRVYDSIGIQITDHIHFAPPKRFAAKAQKIIEKETTISVISTICFSYNLSRFFPIQQYLAPNKLLNSKTALPALAEKYHFTIPPTFVTTIGELLPACTDRFKFPEQSVFVKIDGLGGGYNVKHVTTTDDLTMLQSKYAPTTPCSIQQAIDTSKYIETIHLYTISNTEIRYHGSRAKLTADNQWYGNVFVPDFKLTPRQRLVVDNAALAAQQEGYTAEEPLLIGFDGFMNNEELLITEFNVRWLGSSPPEYALKRLGIYEKVQALSTFDYIASTELTTYRNWVEKNLFHPATYKNRPFSILPLGFSGYEDDGKRVVGFIIIGDPVVCERDIRSTFSEKSFSLIANSLAIFNRIIPKMRSTV